MARKGPVLSYLNSDEYAQAVKKAMEEHHFRLSMGDFDLDVALAKMGDFELPEFDMGKPGK